MLANNSLIDYQEMGYYDYIGVDDSFNNYESSHSRRTDCTVISDCYYDPLFHKEPKPKNIPYLDVLPKNENNLFEVLTKNNYFDVLKQKIDNQDYAGYNYILDKILIWKQKNKKRSKANKQRRRKAKLEQMDKKEKKEFYEHELSINIGRKNKKSNSKRSSGPNFSLITLRYNNSLGSLADCMKSLKQSQNLHKEEKVHNKTVKKNKINLKNETKTEKDSPNLTKTSDLAIKNKPTDEESLMDIGEFLFGKLNQNNKATVSSKLLMPTSSFKQENMSNQGKSNFDKRESVAIF